MAMPATTDFDSQQPVIDAMRGGDRYAFKELVQEHETWVRGVVFGVLGRTDCIDDVCQKVWTQAWRRIGELRDSSTWRSWLYRLAHNAAIDAGREITTRRTRLPSISIEFAHAQAATTDDNDAANERHKEVLDAIRGLPALYREPFVMKHMNGWNYKQISQTLGLPVDTVETRLVRARRLLREALQDKLA